MLALVPALRRALRARAASRAGSPRRSRSRSPRRSGPRRSSPCTSSACRSCRCRRTCSRRRPSRRSCGSARSPARSARSRRALAAPVAELAALPLAYLTWLADRAAALPFAELEIGSPGLGGVVAAYAGAGAAALAWRRAGGAARRRGRAAPPPSRRGAPGAGRARRRSRPARSAAVALAARPPQPPRDLTISFLDIGQGDATLIQHGGAAVLVDTGPPDGPILERLREAGVRRLDLLVATHAALDHDGAAAEVLDEVPVAMVLDGEEARGVSFWRRQARPRTTHPAGRAAPAGPFGARAAVPSRRSPRATASRAPPPTPARSCASARSSCACCGRTATRPRAPGAEPNDRATVIHLRDGDFDLLLTADAESNVTAGARPAARSTR